MNKRYKVIADNRHNIIRLLVAKVDSDEVKIHHFIGTLIVSRNGLIDGIHFAAEYEDQLLAKINDFLIDKKLLNHQLIPVPDEDLSGLYPLAD